MSAGASAIVDLHFVAADQTTPPAVQREIEERGAPLGLAFARRDQGVAGLVQHQHDDPWRRVITPGFAAWERRIDILHAVHLVGALWRNVERRGDLLAIV